MEQKQKKKMGLSTKIFVALFAGALCGVLIHYVIPASYIRDTIVVDGILYIAGNGFIRLMQMLVVPLVFCSLVCGSMEIPRRWEALALKQSYSICLQRHWQSALHWGLRL